jgi:hypothetical protein
MIAIVNAMVEDLVAIDCNASPPCFHLHEFFFISNSIAEFLRNPMLSSASRIMILALKFKLYLPTLPSSRKELLMLLAGCYHAYTAQLKFKAMALIISMLEP